MIEPDSDIHETARRAARAWFGPADSFRLEHAPSGRVNLTFLVTSTKGRFKLQRLHPVFGRDGAVVKNAEAAAGSLTAAGLTASEVIPTLSGRLWVEEEGLWRLMTWLEGEIPSQRSIGAAREAAAFLGLFHRAMADHPPQLLPLPPAEHNREGPGPAGLWEETAEEFRNDPKFERAGSCLERGRALVGGLAPVRPLTCGLIHGDPKLENFLFDGLGRAAALIDLDTIRPGALIWELADGLRSWAAVRRPDDEIHLNYDILLAAVESYKKHGLPLADSEWADLPAAIQGMALNLARRYLRDYFEESYFAWDRARYSSLAEQNLRRGAAMVRLAEQAGTMETVV